MARLLEGSVRKTATSCASPRSSSAPATRRFSRSKTYARELRDVFTVQDKNARDVAQALSVTLDAVTLDRAKKAAPSTSMHTIAPALAANFPGR